MRGLLLSLFVLIVTVPANGQGWYGKDSVACVQNMSLYMEYIEQGNISQAAPFWRKTFGICPPNVRQRIYLDGQKIMRHYMGLSKEDSVRQRELIDTLIMLYDMRLENFPQMSKNNRAQAKTNKALDVINYMKNDDMAVYKACEDAIEEAGENTKAAIIVRYVGHAKNLYNKNMMNAGELTEVYDKAISYIDMVEAANPNDREIKDARGSVEALFPRKKDSDRVQEAKNYYDLALYYYQGVENRVEAVSNAKRAAQLNSDIAGKAYYLIGIVWGTTKCSGNEIEQRAPFWVAVDYMEKAKSADSSLTEDCNNMISNFSRYFPLEADAFMYGLSEGTVYWANCGGLRETTTVKTQK